MAVTRAFNRMRTKDGEPGQVLNVRSVRRLVDLRNKQSRPLQSTQRLQLDHTQVTTVGTFSGEQRL